MRESCTIEDLRPRKYFDVAQLALARLFEGPSLGVGAAGRAVGEQPPELNLGLGTGQPGACPGGAHGPEPTLT